MSQYVRFFAMIATSMVFMYATTYLNTYTLDHIFWSETRLYMTLIMGSVMSVVMLLFMWKMHKSITTNASILAGSVVVFAASVYLVRSQVLVGQISWMEAMIPHHSIAILTSERATISDPKVRELADQIIKAQRKEIGMMKRYISQLEQGRPASDVDTNEAPVGH